MKKYIIYYTANFMVEVEAKDKDEAIEMGGDIDLGPNYIDDTFECIGMDLADDL